MLILTGPTAAGKNTVGHLIARRHHGDPRVGAGPRRCAVIDFDAVRAMFVQPHRAPWQGEEGHAQQLLGVEQVCGLAHGFARAGWEVILLDVVTNDTVILYRRLLAPLAPLIVQLLPDFAELRRRFDERGPCLTLEELEAVYAAQEAFDGFALRIDNTALAPEAAAEQIGALWDAGRPAEPGL